MASPASRGFIVSVFMACCALWSCSPGENAQSEEEIPPPTGDTRDDEEPDAREATVGKDGGSTLADAAVPSPMPSTDAARPETRPDATTVPAAASVGCGVPGASGIVAGQVMGHGFVDVFPTDYNQQHAYPLLLVFHSGNGQEYEPLGLPNNGSRSNLNLGFTDALGNAIIAASVAGADGNYDIKAGSADLAAVQTHLNDLLAKRCIDRSRVYAVGRGAGGKMATAVACRLRSQVRGFARIGSPDVTSIATCGAPVAGFIQAAINSAEVDPQRNAMIAEALRQNNGCSANTTVWPTNDGTCQFYASGCANEPFVNCITAAGIENPKPAETVERAWRFFGALPGR
ncbi:MAG: hypothetical protein SF187_20305 [Deltaproteobacteria bacterium]|nr:hypothetical protein [Deltaproteobacteria bacterium]